MPKPTWVYLIYDKTTKTYKIGNALQPFERLRQLEKIPTKMPFKVDLELIEAWYATEAEEREMHKKFKHRCINGEWFALDEDDLTSLHSYFSLYTRLFSREPKVHTRTCSYCNKRGDYNSFPDGSTVYLGIFSCADCLKKEKTFEFREVLNNYV